MTGSRRRRIPVRVGPIERIAESTRIPGIAAPTIPRSATTPRSFGSPSGIASAAIPPATIPKARLKTTEEAKTPSCAWSGVTWRNPTLPMK
jgi:hypothetical protein